MKSRIATGSRVTLLVATATGPLSRLQGESGAVALVETYPSVSLASVIFDCGAKVANIPLSYLGPEGGRKPSRRGAFRMKAPVDTRTEAQRMDEGVAFLAKRGYVVLRVGQGRVAAVCHACSRENKRLTPIHCKDCGGRGFSPSTNSTEGTPDSFLTHPRWARQDGLPPGFLGLEYKDGPNAKRTPEQQELESKGLIFVAWNLASCLEAVAKYERYQLGIEPLKDIAAYLMSAGIEI